jgi:hypothetical protein
MLSIKLINSFMQSNRGLEQDKANCETAFALCLLPLFSFSLLCSMCVCVGRGHFELLEVRKKKRRAPTKQFSAVAHRLLMCVPVTIDDYDISAIYCNETSSYTPKFSMAGRKWKLCDLSDVGNSGDFRFQIGGVYQPHFQ